MSLTKWNILTILSKYFVSESYGFEDSIGSPKFSPNKYKRKEFSRDNSHGEFQKEKPHTFDGEVKFGK